MKKTKNMALGFIHGLIKRNTQVGGIWVNSMVLVFFYKNQAKRSTESGKMAKN